MRLSRNEIRGQGVMYTGEHHGEDFILYPPNYLIRFIGGRGVPMGAWVVRVLGYRPLLDHDERFSSAARALAYLATLVGELVSLETVEEFKQRSQGGST